jgi:hypothetical protein
VLVLSIVFGLALRQVSSGAMRLLYDDPIDDERHRSRLRAGLYAA